MKWQLVALLSVTVAATSQRAAVGQTVINVPPQIAPTGVSSNTTVNLLDGGSIAVTNPFDVGHYDGTSQNAKFNVKGGEFLAPGSLARIAVYAGGELTVSGGEIVGDLYVRSAGQARIEGGRLNARVDLDIFKLLVDDGATLDVMGGRIDSVVDIDGVANVTGGAAFLYSVGNGGDLDISGGTFGDIRGENGATIALSGSSFRVNGSPIPGTENIGSELQYNPTANSVLSGVLQDGTPFCLIPLPNGIRPGVLTLKTVDAITTPPAIYRASTDPLPNGLGSNQKLIVDAGGEVSRFFVAGPGSQVEIQPDSKVGLGFKAHQATIEILGGEVGQGYGIGMTAIESQVALKGGYINNPKITHHSQLIMTGGRIGSQLDIDFKSNATIAGGVAPYVLVKNESTLNVTGGVVENQIEVWQGSKATISGGKFSEVRVNANGSLEFRGHDFKLNQRDIVGIEPGKPFTIADRGKVLSGILEDGSPFSLALNWPFDSWGNGVSPQAMLKVVVVPEPTVATLTAITSVIAIASKRRRVLR